MGFAGSTDREQKSVKAAKKAAARPGPRADNADCEAVDPAAPKVTVYLSFWPGVLGCRCTKLSLPAINCLGQNTGRNPTQHSPLSEFFVCLLKEDHPCARLFRISDRFCLSPLCWPDVVAV